MSANVMPRLRNILLISLEAVINFYYVHFKKDFYDRHHLDLSWDENGLKVEWLDHADYLLFKEAELRRLQTELAPEDFIISVLRKAKSCNFIIFDCGDDKRFVQFWLADGNLTVSWPLIKKNKLHKYSYAMLGVLNELDITQRLTEVPGSFKTRYQYYELTQEATFEDYKVHFANSYGLAGLFVVKIFTEVFQQGIDKLKFTLG